MKEFGKNKTYKVGDEIIIGEDFTLNRKWYEFWKPKYSFRKGDKLVCTFATTSKSKNRIDNRYNFTLNK